MKNIAAIMLAVAVALSEGVAMAKKSDEAGAKAEKANENLHNAKRNKKDEFYTQFDDIQVEMNAYLDFNADVFKGKTILLPCDDPEWSNFTKFFAQNFELFGIKKLISTSFAFESKALPNGEWQPSLFESENPKFDLDKTKVRGKIFVLDEDTNGNGVIDIEDLKWEYLEGNGDFRSAEVTRLRDEADIIITNPPFSLFREFLAWIRGADGGGGVKSLNHETHETREKKFVIIGNQNAITYKEVFPLIKENKMWLGKGFKGGAGHFISSYQDYASAGDHKEGMIRVSGVVWFTNIEHGRRHQPLMLMTMRDNVKYSKHKEVRGREYRKYDNYDAIEVPFTDAIPSDYDGVMGVPISFLDKYCPEQFEIVWQASGNTRASAPREVLEELKYSPHNEDRGGCSVVDNVRTYGRIFIRKRKAGGAE